jgi:hypothetical protein
MKRILFLSLIFTLTLTACGSTQTSSNPAPITNSYISTNLPADYEGATSVRNQLALGIMALDNTPQVVSAEQAKTLILLWQAVRSIQGSGSAQDEVSTLLKQIEDSLTAEQLSAIAAMKLTQADLQKWAAQNGVTFGNGQPGSGQGMSPEAKATRQAEQGASGGGANTALVNGIITYLQSISQ